MVNPVLDQNEFVPDHFVVVQPNLPSLWRRSTRVWHPLVYVDRQRLEFLRILEVNVCCNALVRVEVIHIPIRQRVADPTQVVICVCISLGLPRRADCYQVFRVPESYRELCTHEFMSEIGRGSNGLVSLSRFIMS